MTFRRLASLGAALLLTFGGSASLRDVRPAAAVAATPAAAAEARAGCCAAMACCAQGTGCSTGACGEGVVTPASRAPGPASGPRLAAGCDRDVTAAVSADAGPMLGVRFAGPSPGRSAERVPAPVVSPGFSPHPDLRDPPPRI